MWMHTKLRKKLSAVYLLDIGLAYTTGGKACLDKNKEQQPTNLETSLSKIAEKSLVWVCAAKFCFDSFPLSIFPMKNNAGYNKSPWPTFYYHKVKQVTTDIWKKLQICIQCYYPTLPHRHPLGSTTHAKDIRHLCMWVREWVETDPSFRLPLSLELAGCGGDFTAMIVIKDICWILIGASCSGSPKRRCLWGGTFFVFLFSCWYKSLEATFKTQHHYCFIFPVKIYNKN